MGIPLSFHPCGRDRGDDGHGHDFRDDEHHVYACEIFQLPQPPMHSYVHAHVHAHDRGCVRDRDGDYRDRDRGHDYDRVSH